MSYFIYTYLIIFSLILLGNTIFCFKHHTALWLVLYELLAGLYLLAVTVVYNYGNLKERINIWLTVPIIIVIATDFYFSVLDKQQKIRPKNIDLEFSESDMEMGTITSIIFAAPAYVSGALLLIDKLLRIG